MHLFTRISSVSINTLGAVFGDPVQSIGEPRQNLESNGWSLVCFTQVDFLPKKKEGKTTPLHILLSQCSKCGISILNSSASWLQEFLLNETQDLAMRVAEDTAQRETGRIVTRRPGHARNSVIKFRIDILQSGGFVLTYPSLYYNTISRSSAPFDTSKRRCQ